jgi:transposase InsO family protein
MPWNELPIMDQRASFIHQLQHSNLTMAELCRHFGISRKTGYKWQLRHAAEGIAGLADRSRAPHHCPHRVSDEIVSGILSCRDEYGWGPKKIRVILYREQPAIAWPSLTTIHEILKTHGRTVPRKKRRRVPPHTAPFVNCDGPNVTWCCDFKGQFATGQHLCYPLTITDAFSRFLLCCQGLYHPDGPSVQPFFERAFKEYGLPQVIHSDNGCPFASRAIAGLSRLSVGWIKLGIRPERIAPGHPEENGRHERMHSTLKQETASPPSGSVRKQQKRFDAFVERYNCVRPHEGLEMATPGSVYECSPREYPSRIPEIEYPAEWAVRKVQQHGECYWKGSRFFVSEVLGGERIGFESVTDRYCRVWFSFLYLGVFDTHCCRMLNAAECRRRPELKLQNRQDCSSAALQNDPADS